MSIFFSYESQGVVYITCCLVQLVRYLKFEDLICLCFVFSLSAPLWVIYWLPQLLFSSSFQNFCKVSFFYSVFSFFFSKWISRIFCFQLRAQKINYWLEFPIVLPGPWDLKCVFFLLVGGSEVHEFSLFPNQFVLLLNKLVLSGKGCWVSLVLENFVVIHDFFFNWGPSILFLCIDGCLTITNLVSKIGDFTGVCC